MTTTQNKLNHNKNDSITKQNYCDTKQNSENTKNDPKTKLNQMQNRKTLM